MLIYNRPKVIEFHKPQKKQTRHHSSMSWIREDRDHHTTLINRQRKLGRMMWKNISHFNVMELGQKFGSNPVDVKFDSTCEFLAIATTEKPPNAARICLNHSHERFVEVISS
jgi:hypothetical protein